MKSLWAQYMNERQGTKCIELEDGFVAYKIGEGECFLQELYIVPAKRRSGLAAKLLNDLAEVAKRKECNIITATVDVRDPGATNTISWGIKMGFKLFDVRDKLLLWAKEI